MKPYPKYKDSGVEQIGEVPEHWEVKRSDGIIFSDKNLVAPDTFRDEEVYHYSIPAIQQHGTGIYEDGNSIKSAKQIVTETCLLVSKLNPRKSTICISKPQNVKTISSTEFVVLKTRSCFIEFLCYFCQSDFFRQYLDSRVQSGTRSHQRVSPEDIYRFFAAWPSREEQTTIATFLNRKTAEIDSIISKKERLIELYEEEKAAVINHAVTKGLDPDAKMKDSGIEWLGEIPEHWEVKKLKHLVCKIGSGVTPKGGASVYQQSGIPLLRSQNIHFDGLRLDDVAYISDEIHNNMSGSKVISGDVLLNITGASIGRCYFVDDQLGEANVNQHVCIIRPSKGFITKFIYFLLCSNVGQIQIDLEQTGGGREGLNFESLGSFAIPSGRKNEQSAIVQHIETKCRKIDTIISKFKRQIELLKEYRTALISEAVTGKIDVRNEI